MEDKSTLVLHQGIKMADRVSTRIEKKLAQLPHTPSEPCIFRVDDPLRRENEQAYEPEFLAVGPYHHGKHNLQMMEEQKWRYLKLLLQRRHETSVARYIMALRGLGERARRCYAGSEITSLDEDEFVQIMLLDGFFIIELFRKYRRKLLRDKSDFIFQLKRVRYKLRRDLLLLENQLPFFILAELFKMTEPSNSEDTITELALGFLSVMLPAGSKALESSFRIPIEEEGNVETTDRHLLSLLHSSWCRAFPKRGIEPPKEELKFIKSTTELLNTGIRLQKAKKNKFLLDIEYKNGVMYVPPLTIDDNTECIFRNLIAYEQCRPEGAAQCVSDYCMFMDCLISSPQDVQELRYCGIIDNWLCEDKLVSRMFNRFGTNIFISQTDFCYSEIFNQVNKHCRHPCNIWVANLRRDYFNTPWAIISFLAASVLLLLTFAQTLFPILPFFR